jgi:homoserine kinase
VTVSVPATSANLGPGYDTLGLALSLHDDVSVTVTGGGLTLDVSGEGAADVADAGEKHLIVRSMRAAFDALGCAQPPGLALRCVNRIPHGRGLGSSAAAIVAGVLAARALAGAPVAPDVALPLASELEGHPDNVAPCLFGGLTVAWLDTPGDNGGRGLPLPGGNGGLAPHAQGGAGGDRPPEAKALRLEPLPQVRPVAIIPSGPVSTEVARGLLPASVTHADAARNAGRAALLVAALTASPEAAQSGQDLSSVLLAATEDRLHQDYRAPAMPQTHDLVRRLREIAVPAVVSGAGPTVLAFLTSAQFPARTSASALAGGEDSSIVGLEKLDSTAKEAGIDWRISPLDIERRGARVTAGAPSAR